MARIRLWPKSAQLFIDPLGIIGLPIYIVYYIGNAVSQEDSLKIHQYLLDILQAWEGSFLKFGAKNWVLMEKKLVLVMSSILIAEQATMRGSAMVWV